MDKKKLYIFFNYKKIQIKTYSKYFKMKIHSIMRWIIQLQKHVVIYKLQKYEWFIQKHVVIYKLQFFVRIKVKLYFL